MNVGFYWVQKYKTDDWEVARFDGGDWWSICRDETPWTTEQFYMIGAEVV